MTTRQQLIDEARTWLGTPYHHQGRVKGVGVDCINFVLGVAEATDLIPDGFSMEPYSGYGRIPDPKKIIGGCERFMDRIDKKEARMGDVLVLRFVREPQHFAIVSNDNPRRMIHSYASVLKVTEQIIDAEWESKIVAAYRIKGLED